MNTKSSKRDMFLNYQIQKIAEELKGGVADEKKPEDIAPDKEKETQEVQKEVLEGASVEMEHTEDPKAAMEVASDHIEEYPAGEEYYEDLKEMEESAKLKAEKGLGDPSPDDKGIIGDFVKTQADLDDGTMHKLYEALGVDPEEGEEVLYAALQEYMQKFPGAVDMKNVEEKEVEMDEPDDSGEVTTEASQAKPEVEKEASQAKKEAVVAMGGYLLGYMQKKASDDAKKEKEEEEEKSSILEEAGPNISPVKVARAAEAQRGDPAQPLKDGTPPPDEEQKLPKGWDTKSLSVDGPIA